MIHKKFRFYFFRLGKMKFIFLDFFQNQLFIIVIVLVSLILLSILIDGPVSDGIRSDSPENHFTNDTIKTIKGGCLPFNKACLIMQ